MSRSRATHFELVPTGQGGARSGGDGRGELLDLVSSVGLGGSATAGRFFFFTREVLLMGPMWWSRGPLKRYDLRLKSRWERASICPRGA